MQAAGFVLVGGRSSRMGRDKALLEWNAHRLVEEVAARVRDVAGNMTLVGAPERYQELGYACIADLRPGLGPLAGIEAALAEDVAELNLIVACDMPAIEARWLRSLLEHANQTGARSVVLRDAAAIVHPLCAVYHRDCLPEIRRLLDAGRLRARDAVRELRAAIIDVDTELANVNTPEEWNAWRMAAPLTNAG